MLGLVLCFTCLVFVELGSFNYELETVFESTTSYHGFIEKMESVLKDILRPFNGEGDVVVWLDKVKLVAELKGKTNELGVIIPLMLEGDAFAVFSQMEKAKRTDAEAIEKLLLEAFASDPFSALVRRWTSPEAVDVFMADLRRLAQLAGVENDALVRGLFVCGLPPDVSTQLRAASQITACSLEVVVAKARILMGERTQATALVAARVGKRTVGAAGGAAGESASTERRQVVSPRCDGERPVRFNDKRRAFSGVCWSCKEVGHRAFECPVVIGAAGNAMEKVSAPAPSPK